MCGGLPEVIAAIAGSLAWKRDTTNILHYLNRRFIQYLETAPEYDGLQDLFLRMHSYFRTYADSLKPCIFYLAVFPRGHIFRRKRIVRRWIAEGYCKDSHIRTAEEIGELRFSQLLEESMIQHVTQSVSTALSDTRTELCQVNGFFREYIVSRDMEDNLVSELGDECRMSTKHTVRHLLILDKWKRNIIVFMSMDFSRLRSLTVFGEWESFFISKRMKMLRVLDLENASPINDGDLNKMVKWLHRLKFLSLRGHTEIYHLPGSLHHLRQLQTLDVRGTSITALPGKITRLQKLQYIRAGTMDFQPPVSSDSCRWLPEFSRRHHLGVEVPRWIGKLTSLHTLGVVSITCLGAKNTMKELKKLSQLRKLGVSGMNKKNTKEFLSLMEGHGHLESLLVHIKKDNQGCLDHISMPWENLQSLKLYGLGNKLPQLSNQLIKLRKLALEMDTLKKNDMELLARLPALCVLRLRVKQQLQDGKLHFYAEMYGLEFDTFEKVKILEISCSSSELQVTFGSESMKNLELLKIDYSGASYQLAGMNNLSELKQVLLKGTNHDEAFRAEFASHLANHPRQPVVKLEEQLPRSS